MMDKLQLIGYTAIVIIVISLASLGMKFTGFASTTDTGVVNVTISSSAAINFTTDFVSFGTGSVSAGQTSATVNTEGTLTGGTGWVGANNFTLENIGNVNVTLNFSSSKNASTFIGGSGGGGPHFQYKIINDTEPNSCVGNSAITYTEFALTNSSGCMVFPFADDRDSVKIAIQLTIPSDSLSGTVAQTATVTATGTYT